MSILVLSGDNKNPEAAPAPAPFLPEAEVPVPPTKILYCTPPLIDTVPTAPPPAPPEPPGDQFPPPAPQHFTNNDMGE
jgi:hypothetical protein